MNRIARIVTITSALALLGVPLAACSDFDPQDIVDSIFSGSKKPLPGDRKALFPSGTPGVQQGVPPDLVKGYQPQPDVPVNAQADDQDKPKPKPKPKPKVAAPAAAPATTTAAAPATTAAAPAPAQTRPMQTQAQPWPGQQTQTAAPAWPDPPVMR
jgi:hypothetical protein